MPTVHGDGLTRTLVQDETAIAVKDDTVAMIAHLGNAGACLADRPEANAHAPQGARLRLDGRHFLALVRYLAAASRSVGSASERLGSGNDWIVGANALGRDGDASARVGRKLNLFELVERLGRACWGVGGTEQVEETESLLLLRGV